ncbi:MAG: patatin-like phospholipase family protein [Thermodesulfobacteriota bacterium]|nr:patatin-like phospholipase family protein [Thermodesulfobacteriota bacterium]
MRLRKKKRVALALGAGGARGIAHIGVIRALLEEGIPIDAVAGASLGSIVGALYSLYMNIDTTEKKIRQYMESDFFQETTRIMENFERPDQSFSFLKRIQVSLKKGYFYTMALTRPSLVTPERFLLNMKTLVGENTFEDMKLPFKCLSVDLVTGNPIVLCDGDLTKALQASCASPGFFPPVASNGMLLVDGGVAEMVPYYLAKTFRPDYIIGVDVTRDVLPLSSSDDHLIHSLDVVFRSYDITRDFANVCTSERFDRMIRPDIGGYNWSDFEHIDTYIEKGYLAAKAQARRIKRDVFWVYM